MNTAAAPTRNDRPLRAGACPCCGQNFYFDKPTVSLELNSVSFRGRTIYLTRTLTEMAFAFAEAMPRTLTRDALFDRVWGCTDTDYTSKTIDVCLMRLREHLSGLGLSIETIRNTGWRMVVS